MCACNNNSIAFNASDMSITYNKNEHHIRMSFRFHKLILLTLKFELIAFSRR